MEIATSTAAIFSFSAIAVSMLTVFVYFMVIVVMFGLIGYPLAVFFSIIRRFLYPPLYK